MKNFVWPIPVLVTLTLSTDNCLFCFCLYSVIANFKLHAELESRVFPLNNFTEDTALKTVLLGVRQSQPHAQLSLYIDCVSQGTIKTVKTFRDIFMNMRNPQILFVSTRTCSHALVSLNSRGISKAMIIIFSLCVSRSILSHRVGILLNVIQLTLFV